MEATPTHYKSFTPEEAAQLHLQELGSPNSSGMGILEVPPSFTSYDTQYRIRVAMLNAMEALATGPSLNVAKRDFMIDYRGVLTPMTFALFNAEWDYLASIREALYEGLTKTLNCEPERKLIETVTLLRAFVDAYHKKGERMDFGLFRAYVSGFTDGTTLSWFRSIWDGLEFNKKQTFFQRLSTLREFTRLPRTPA
jgi:hypothetical protein